MDDGAPPAPSYVNLLPGDPVPWFTQRCSNRTDFTFDRMAGRYLVLCFYGSAADALGRKAVDAVLARRPFFDDERACFFGVSNDPGDEVEARVRNIAPGIRHLWDFDGSVSRLYGAMPKNADGGVEHVPPRRFWLVLDPTLHVMAKIPFAEDAADHAALFSMLDRLPPTDRFAGIEIPAPIIALPNVFEPAFCRHLIALYEANGGGESGFMRDTDGKTFGRYDHSYKSRKDYVIEDDDVIRQTHWRLSRRIIPEILKIHSFKATRIERYIVACYAAEDGGHFRPHRDNTTKATVHRRFAVSVNLNDDFDGGEVRFPEYGRRGYKIPAGGAIVFSCAMLHAVTTVTRGRRYAFLPFLYDAEAAKLRAEARQFLATAQE